MDFVLGDSVVERAMTCSYTMDLSSSYSSSILAMSLLLAIANMQKARWQKQSA
jgi:hypothetical protein